MTCWLSLLALLLFLGLPHNSQCSRQVAGISDKMVPIKELSQPRNYPPVYHQNPFYPVKRVPARRAVGPAHLVRSLLGQCYSAVFGHYEYRLCPFDNATQRDVSFQMLAIFHGVIGVYNGWLTHNASLAAMSMPNGEPCPLGAPGSYRGTLVQFQCGNATSLVSVHESPVCQYRMVLATPLVCHPQAMLAYPCLARLRPDFQAVWDAAYTMHQRGFINESSYTQLVNNLLFRAELLADTRVLAMPAEAAAAVTALAAKSVPTSAAAGGNASKVVGAGPHGNFAVVSEDRKRAMDLLAQQILALQRQVELRRPPPGK